MLKSNKYLKPVLIFLLIPCLAISQTDNTSSDLLKDKLESIDSVIAEEMKKFHIPGAVVTLVQDEQIVFSKGYGYSNIDEQRLVKASSTGFKIASLTKTFTATAVLQLVEKGKLDLYKDITTYLPDHDFSFVKDDPINLHQLLTHTAGFDYTDIGDAARTKGQILSIENVVRHHMPKRVHKPGTVYSYSNYGYTLIGYIIEQVTGVSYSDYIKINILEKLDMSNTSLEQPLTERLEEKLAKSYSWDNGHKTLNRDYTNTLPAGGVVSTGADMGNYMIMHLNEGQYDSTSILNPNNHNKLLTNQYGSKYTPYGICYSFFEEEWLGWRTLSHTGGQLGFLSQLLLIPEANIGIFISHNSREGAEPFRGIVSEVILKLVIGNNPDKKSSIKRAIHSNTKLDKYEGVYKQANHPISTFEKTALLMGRYDSEVEVYRTTHGLLINNYEFFEIDKGVFKINDSIRNSTVEFFQDGTGKADRLLYGKESFVKIPFYKQSNFLRTVFIVFFLMLFIQFLSKPLKKLVASSGKKTSISNGYLGTWLYWTGSLYVVAALLLYAHVEIYGGQLSDYGIPWTLNIAFVLNIIAGLSSILFPLAVVNLWNNTNFGLPNKIYKSMIIVSIVGLGLVFWNHNLIGFYY